MAQQSAGGARGAAFAYINKRNAAANFDNAFRNVGARPDGQGGAKTGTGDAAEGEDVFQRRKTRNVNYWNVGKAAGAADAGGARPAGPGSALRRTATPAAVALSGLKTVGRAELLLMQQATMLQFCACPAEPLCDSAPAFQHGSTLQQHVGCPILLSHKVVS